MDDAILERLILDDALGALSPDSSALLAAYAQTFPGGDERLSVWKQLAETARTAMPRDSIEALPPFPSGGHAFNPWRIGRIGLSVAAALALGVCIGLWMPQRPGPSPQLAVAPQPIVAEMPSSGGVHDFWSSQRLLASAMQQKQEPSAVWHWSSPVSEPEFGVTK